MLTRLFPSKAFPTLGTFCLERAKALSRHADVRVMVPTPWFPSWLPGLSEWRKWGCVEAQGMVEGCITVTYPRYLSIPKIATWPQGIAMAHAARQNLATSYGGWIPEVVDGHYGFPDGYAAVKLAKHLKCPSVVTCHGSDLRLYPELPIAGSMLKWSLGNADRVISVSTDLQRKSVELGCLESRSAFLPNGVDPDKFKLRSRIECRQQLGLPLEGRIGVCVAALIDVKNQFLIIRAMNELRLAGHPLPLIVLVGEGANRNSLEQEVQNLGLQDRIIFAGQRPHAEVATWMGAADWLLLSSNSEGWATVYFEAMSCGRPVLTTNVSSAKDAICKPEYGQVIEPPTPEAFAKAIIEASAREFDAQAIRAYAEAHTWDNWADKAMIIIKDAIHSHYA